MLTVTISGHGMPCIEVVNPIPEVRRIIRRAVTNPWMGDPDYEVSRRAGAFLQCDDASDDAPYVLVEFWQEDYQSFVDYLNEQLTEGMVKRNSRKGRIRYERNT